MAACNVWWRRLAVRLMPANNWKVLSSPAEICSTDMVLMRAAASSIANGIPSNCWQICVMVTALSSSGVKSGLTALARSTNRHTPSYSMSKSSKVICTSGIDKGGTGHTFSPAKLNASRLVARIFKFAQDVNSDSAMCAQASIRCSQLSRTSKTLLLRKYCFSVSVKG